ncbi:hypothetical protein LINGRAHAP2_LOCUS23781 [Linum grandiflorum]
MATDNKCTSPPTPWGSRYWRRPTPVVTRSISSGNNNANNCPILVSCRKRRARISWISQLGEDLLVEILIRSFPDPKSACRCKAVCKRWSSLILSPCFNRRFVNMNLLLYQPMPYNSNELASVILSFLPPMPMPDRFSILDCFKDLVLCGFWDANSWSRRPMRSYLICNPFTKKWIALPLAPCYLKRGHAVPVARLVCEPRISTNLDLGDDQEAFIYSEYRFRVVHLVQDLRCSGIKADVFCSESGEWITNTKALDLCLHLLHDERYVCSWNGKLFWACTILKPTIMRNLVGVFDPFRLDIPATFIDTCRTTLLPPEVVCRPIITVSQDAVYLIAYNYNKYHTRNLRIAELNDPGVIIIWRLDVQDGKYSWGKKRKGLVKKSKCCWCGCERKVLVQPYLHPYNPEIVLFKCFDCGSHLYSCDLTREGEVKLLGKLEKVEANHDDFYAKVIEPRFSCWPTPIPTYKELPEHIHWI